MYDKDVAAPIKIDEVTERRDKWMSDMTPDKYVSILDVMSKFRNYSVNNNALIAMQRPDAAFLASFDDWKAKFGRSVNKGSKGIDFIKPEKVKKLYEGPDPNNAMDTPVIYEKEFTNFKVVPMFDVSDTHGRPLPAFVTDELNKSVDDVARFKQAFESLKGVHCTYDDIKAQVIDMVKDKVTTDLEKYSVAYIVCKHYGIGTAEFSFENKADQMKGELKDIRSSLNKVSKTSREILNSIDGKINEIRTAERGAVEQPSEPSGDTVDTPFKGEDTLKKRDVKSLKDSLLEKLKGNKETVNDRCKKEIRITGPSKDRAI